MTITKKNNDNEIISLFIKVIWQITAHPLLNNYLIKDDNANYININMAEKHSEENELAKLITDLIRMCHTFLISSSGNHSGIFYKLKYHGILCKTGERDTYGPLTGMIGPESGDWLLIYG